MSKKKPKPAREKLAAVATYRAWGYDQPTAQKLARMAADKKRHGADKE